MSEVQIAGQSYPVGRLDVQQMTACLAAAKYLQPMTEGKVFESLTDEGMDSTIEALRVVTGCERNVLEQLPVHEFVQAVGNVAEALFQENLEYLNGEVAQALHEVTTQLTAITSQAEGTNH